MSSFALPPGICSRGNFTTGVFSSINSSCRHLRALLTMRTILKSCFKSARIFSNQDFLSLLSGFCTLPNPKSSTIFKHLMHTIPRPRPIYITYIFGPVIGHASLLGISTLHRELSTSLIFAFYIQRSLFYIERSCNLYCSAT